MVDRDALVAYLAELLDADAGGDYGPNGLQVEGRREVRRLVTGVSACRELFVQARERRADAVLVHHGLLWQGDPLPLTGFRYRRMRELILGEINLLAYHLPLDRHPVYGNNAVAARAFGLVDLEPFAPHQGLPTGCKGRFPEPIAAAELEQRCARVYGRRPLAFLEGPPRVATLALVSGAAQRELYRAVDERLDAFLTGEVSEWVMNVARETGVHYLAAGHYATERCGVQALGEHLGGRFDLEVDFVDVDNPV